VKILLTGPTGFIGSTFLRLALQSGHQVAGLVIPSEQVPSDLPPSRDLLWLRGTLDQAPWPEIASFRPDVCIHTAWITTPGVYLESPDNERFRDASFRFLKSVRESGTNHIVSLGTCVEYQITHEPLAEDKTPVLPTTLYARSKNELRLALEAEADADWFTCCWCRVFYPYGPREHPSRLCSSIIQKLARNETITLKTPNSTKDYIYIDDLASALLTVVEKHYAGIINLGTGIGVNVRQIAQTLGDLMSKRHLIEELDPPEVDPLGYVVADVTRLQQLGWRPAHTLKQGLQNLIASLAWRDGQK
jgi:nucleoside-diphosphate-sugar epimerase